MNTAVFPIYRLLALVAPWAALSLLAFFPQPMTAAPAGQTLPVVIHLITLGFIVPLFLLALYRQLGEKTCWSKMTLPTALVFLVGMLLFMPGFWTSHRMVLYIGGHYLTPTALYVFCGQAAWTLWKNKGDRNLSPWAWPLGGLFLTINIGGMLVADRFYGGKYAFYVPTYILTHLLSALFLFVIPWILVAKGKTEKLGWIFLGGLGVVTCFLYGHFTEEPQAWSLAAIIGAGMFFMVGRAFNWLDEAQKPLKLGWFLGALGLILASLGRGVALFEGPGFLAFGFFLIFGLLLPSLLAQTRCAPGLRHRICGHLGLLLGWLMALSQAWALPPQPVALIYLAYWIWVSWPLAKAEV